VIFKEGTKMSTKKFSIKDLEKTAFAYEEAQVNEKKFSAIKQSCKVEIDKILRALKTDLVEVDVKAPKPLRVQRVYKRSIVYDILLLRSLLKPKGKQVLQTAFTVSVNNQGLEDLYSSGVVQYDELQECIKEIKEKDQISVLRVKRELRE